MGVEVTEQDAVRNFYRRFAAALPEPADQKAFERQVARAEIVPVDEEHDEFKFVGATDPHDALNVDTLEGIYADADGQGVNVIVHFAGDHISWAERYRNLGDPITVWPPPDNAPLRLGRDRDHL